MRSVCVAPSMLAQLDGSSSGRGVQLLATGFQSCKSAPLSHALFCRAYLDLPVATCQTDATLLDVKEGRRAEDPEDPHYHSVTLSG